MTYVQELADLVAVDSAAGMRDACSREVFDSLEDHFRTCGAVTSVGLLLRMREPFLTDYQALANGSLWFDDLFRKSLVESTAEFDGPLSIVRKEWPRVVGDKSPWAGILELPSLHACSLRGPVSALGQFFRSPKIRCIDSPVAGVVLPVPLSIPERGIHDGPMPPELREILERLAEISCDNNSAQGKVSQEVLLESLSFLSASDCLAAIRWLGGAGKLLLSLCGEQDIVIRRLRAVLDHLQRWHGGDSGLGIGDLRVLGPNPGRGQKVCVVDSGADESSPFLQRQVIDYSRFDTLSQSKEAYACMDFGCHGTKVASLICGQVVSLRELGLDSTFVRRLLGQGLEHWGLVEETMVRVGVAPCAKIGVVGVLGGDPMTETGDAVQILAGLGRAAACQSFGYSVLNVSIEAAAGRIDQNTQDSIGKFLDMIHRRGMLPVLAAGNNGVRSVPLGRNACVVGAVDVHGKPVTGNGPYYNLLAPGTGILCAQPRMQRLGNLLIDKYSGSSMATAIVSGCIAGLCGSVPGATSDQAFEALRSTTLEGVIQVDAAHSMLMQ